MQIMPVSYGYYQTRCTSKNNVSFSGGKQELIPVAVETFKTDSARKMYPKIRGIFRMIGNCGGVKEAAIFSEPTHYYSFEKHGFVDSRADVLLSISKNTGVTNMTLSKQYADTQKRMLLMDVFFDNEGKMIKGSLPSERMEFERKGVNVRRMKCNGNLYLPVAGKEKVWEHSGTHLTSNDCVATVENNSRGGAFEIFMELARLKTSVLK